MEKLPPNAQIELRYGGPALADEVFDDSNELRGKINEVIDWINKQESSN